MAQIDTDRASATPHTADDDGKADVSGVVENMLKTRAAQQGGVAFEEMLATEGLLEDRRPEAKHEGSEVDPQVTFLASGNDLAIRARPAETIDTVTPHEPGLSPRGWSAEVTARHPKLVAETMAELASEGKVAASAEDPVDPTDPVALALAQRDLGFIPVIANNLRVAAMQRNNDRLSMGIEAASYASPAAQAAVALAVEEAQHVAEGITAPGQASPEGSRDEPKRAARSAPKASSGATTTTTSGSSSGSAHGPSSAS